MRGLLVPVLAAAAGLLLVAACAEAAIDSEAIVSTIPWPDEERASYVLLDRDGEEELGHGTLSVRRLDGEFELKLSFEVEGDTDESTVVVDAETLAPGTVRRERNIGGEQELVEARYDLLEETIRTVVTQDGEERSIPRRLPDGVYYDNESSLFLWRTIAFAEEYEADYYTVLANQGGTNQAIHVRVLEREEITVPAGTYQAWRVEISTPDRKQQAWFSDTPERLLVQYDNSFQLFRLTAVGE